MKGEKKRMKIRKADRERMDNRKIGRNGGERERMEGMRKTQTEKERE